MERLVAKFSSFAEAEKSNIRFLRSLSGNERLKMLLQIIRSHESDDEQGFKRVYRIIHAQQGPADPEQNRAQDRADLERLKEI
jgi:hypothetical protein